MRSSQDNKAVVLSFLEAILDKRPADAVDMCTSDATWWFSGTLELSGSHPVRDVFPGAAKLFKDRIAPATGGIGVVVAEGDYVTAESWSRSELSGDRLYHNNVLMLFRLEDGKIASIKEYGDTELLFRLFGGRLAD